MSPITIVLLVITAILAIGLVVLYFVGKRMQKKQEEQQAQMEAASQTVSMLVIDKKRLKDKVCHLDSPIMQRVNRALQISLELDT